MSDAHIVLDRRMVIAPVSRRTFGSFVEHVGRCIYSGIFEPGHPRADENGFRLDVVDLVRELGVTTVRYPGGNFVSGYRWEDGVGPLDQRPVRLDLAWHSTEPNTFGLGEFMKWTDLAGVEPMMAVNLGTRGITEAIDLLEYSNRSGGSALSDLRRAHGHDQPFNIRMWCLGNELDGTWQVGHKTATEYGRLAAETARAMRRFDPTLELVACGSSGPQMSTFAAWEREVLDACYEEVDFISIHRYYEEVGGDLPSFLASAVDMDQFIEAVIATVDHVKAAKKSDRHINLSFDEWNVWYQSRAESKAPTGDDWPVGPVLLEDCYSVADAVVVGNMMISLLRHSDRVTSASQAQLVNVIAPIMTEPTGKAWRQTTFYPFAQMSAHAHGMVLRLEPISVPFHTEKFGDVAAIDAAATWDEQSGILAVFIVNRDPYSTHTVDIDFTGFRPLSVLTATTLTNPDHYARNSNREPGKVMPVPCHVTLQDCQVRLVTASVSWTVLTLSLRE